MSRVLPHRATPAPGALLEALVADTVTAVAERIGAELAARLVAPEGVTALVDQVVEAAAQRVAVSAVEAAAQLAAAQQTVGMGIVAASKVSGIGQGELRRLCKTPATSPRHLRCARIGKKVLIRRAELERLLQALEQ